MLDKIKNFILDLLFPKFCLNCKREGKYLCEDCQAILEISGLHRSLPLGKNLNDLYWAVEYKNPLVKKLIQSFKYEPFVKELSKSLASLIINHFSLLENQPEFKDFILIPIPLEKRKLRWRGFNQAEEIAKELAKFLNLSVINNVLIKTKETLPQVELDEEKRKENVKGVFSVKNKEIIKNKKILLIDDVYTTGATMEEGADTLKKSGAKEVIGVVVARASPDEDKFQNL